MIPPLTPSQQLVLDELLAHPKRVWLQGEAGRLGARPILLAAIQRLNVPTMIACRSFSREPWSTLVMEQRRVGEQFPEVGVVGLREAIGNTGYRLLLYDPTAPLHSSQGSLRRVARLLPLFDYVIVYDWSPWRPQRAEFQAAHGFTVVKLNPRN